ncbi:MAG: hypothetical protein HQK58_00430 [Deltaproteobacteria bacterium]|nr:hypothetical protein [Deltaproteobacteria bacterium]
MEILRVNDVSVAAQPAMAIEFPTLEQVRLSDHYFTEPSSVKLVHYIPIKKPTRYEYLTVWDRDDMILRVLILDMKDDSGIHLVSPSLSPTLEGLAKPTALFLSVNRAGDHFLWPVQLPGPDGRWNPWHQSAMEAVNLAKTNWVRVQANLSLGAYDIYRATASIPDPEWPDITLDEILKMAFRDRFINSLEHPILKRLRGEI